jgi:hypothetical protein
VYGLFVLLRTNLCSVTGKKGKKADRLGVHGSALPSPVWRLFRGIGRDVARYVSTIFALSVRPLRVFASKSEPFYEKIQAFLLAFMKNTIFADIKTN